MSEPNEFEPVGAGEQDPPAPTEGEKPKQSPTTYVVLVGQGPTAEYHGDEEFETTWTKLGTVEAYGRPQALKLAQDTWPEATTLDPDVELGENEPDPMIRLQFVPARSWQEVVIDLEPPEPQPRRVRVSGL